MNEISTFVDGERMTSLQIAEITGKNHFDVMRAIRKMEPAWLKIDESKFALVEYKDKKGEKRPCYSLNKEECLYIATKFNDEARAKLIKRWKELEEQSKPIRPTELSRSSQIPCQIRGREAAVGIGEPKAATRDPHYQQREHGTWEQDYRDATQGKLLRSNPAKQCNDDRNADSTGLRNECNKTQLAPL